MFVRRKTTGVDKAVLIFPDGKEYAVNPLIILFQNFTGKKICCRNYFIFFAYCLYAQNKDIEDEIKKLEQLERRQCSQKILLPLKNSGIKTLL
jgi:hypothetical protein